MSDDESEMAALRAHKRFQGSMHHQMKVQRDAASDETTIITSDGAKTIGESFGQQRRPMGFGSVPPVP